MAETTPQNIDPATDPQVENPPSTEVPVAQLEVKPDEINPTVDPQVAVPPVGQDAAVYELPEVRSYLETQARLDALDKLRAAEGNVFVVQDPELLAAETAIRNAQAQAAARLEEQGILQIIQRDAEAEQIAADAAKPPVGGLADYYNAIDAAEEPPLATIEVAPTAVEAANDPQVVEAQIDTVPVSGIELAPVDVTQDPEVFDFEAAQEAGTFVPINDIDIEPAAINEANDPQVVEPASDIVPAATIETTPLEIASADDPQVPAIEPTTPATDIDMAPAGVDPAIDPQAAEPAIAQAVDINQGPETVDPADDPIAQPTAASFEPALVEIKPEPILVEGDIDPAALERTADLPEPFIYQAANPPTQDAVVLAQADNIATDAIINDTIDSPPLVDTDLDPETPRPAAPTSAGGFYGEPTPIGGNYTAVYNPETGTYDVVDIDTGQTVETGLSQQTATIVAQDFSLGDPQFPNDTEALAAAANSDLVREPTDVDVAEAAFTEQGDGFFVLNEEVAPQPDQYGFVETEGGLFVQQDEIEAQIDQEQFEDALGAQELSASDIVTEPEDISLDQQYQDEPEGTILDLNTGERVTAGQAQADAARAQALVDNARNQQSIRDQRRNVDSADWRVRLRLAPNSTYLYNASDAGILEPLSSRSGSDGVIFPYTPTIQTVYKSNYSQYDLTHSNYRGYFYQGSVVEDIQITGTFTAQDTLEAQYLLAVIHFFRSVTKMFYGQDPQRGAPPPLVYLSAFGEYQYVDAPCVVSSFNYNLPADVDYIRARSPNQDGTNLLKRRNRNSVPTNAISFALERLKNARLPQGGKQPRPPPPTLGLNSPTYVPTKMEITIILHPVQSRQQISQQFSLRDYAAGRLQTKGYW